MSSRLSRRLDREIEAEAFDNYADIARHLVEERGFKLPDVIAAFDAIGKYWGEGPEVEKQVDVDDSSPLYSFLDWHQFSDESILSEDGFEAIGDPYLAAEGYAQDERDDALLAMHESREDY